MFFPENKENVDDPIWVFWNEGMDKAPEIVKACYKSIQKYSDRKVILLTDENEKDYIQMPGFLEQKRENGMLPLAIYTDLMRVALLEHYGGIWLDSTIYLTASIPPEILNSDFFVFHNSLGEIDNPVLYPVWFIRTKKHNKTIAEIRNVLFSYWQRESHIREYLFSNIVITQIIKASPEFERDMPYLNSDYSEYLVRRLGDRYTETDFSWIKELTGIHKLTHKLDLSINKEGTVYHHIVEKLYQADG